MIHRRLTTFFEGVFPDKRLDKRAGRVLDSIIKKGTAVVGRCSPTLPEQIGAYRMLNNKNVTEEDLGRCLYRHTM